MHASTGVYGARDSFPIPGRGREREGDVPLPREARKLFKYIKLIHETRLFNSTVASDTGVAKRIINAITYVLI